MALDRVPDTSTRRSWIAWVLAVAAFLLGLLALVVVLEDWVSGKRTADPWTTYLNLLTELTGVLGASATALPSSRLVLLAVLPFLT